MRHSTAKVGLGGLLMVCLLAPAAPALGSLRPDDRAGIRGAGPAAAAAQLRPDDRSGPRGAGPAAPEQDARVAAVARPDDRAGIRGIVSEAPTVAADFPQPPPVAADGFDWTAAGAGAGTATAVLLFLGGLLALRRTRHPLLSA